MSETEQPTQVANGADRSAEGAVPSLTVDFEGASTVEVPPPNGEYDFTVLRFNHVTSKAEKDGERSKATYIDAQLQLDSEPAMGRQVYDMLLTTFADGVTVVGTPQAHAKGWSMPNLALAVVKALGLPANSLRQMGEVTGVVGAKLRGKFRAKKDNRSGDDKLRLDRVLGKATGAPSTAGKVAAAAHPVESF